MKQQAIEPLHGILMMLFLLDNMFVGRELNYGVLKVNCDRAYCGKSFNEGYGWVIRDFAGLLQVAHGEGGLFFNAPMTEATTIRATFLVCIYQGCAWCGGY